MGVYWNNAIHWIWKDILYGEPVHRVLGIVPGASIAYIKTPNYLVDVTNAYTLFESRGCLLLIVRKGDDKYHVFEMRNEYSGWLKKCSVYLDDIITRVWALSSACVVLGEREEDSFMVVEVYGNVFQYKFLSKTVSTLCNSESSSSLRIFPFIPSLASV